MLANGSLTSTQSGEGTIRERLIRDDLVDCIVALTGQLFYTTGIPLCLWFLDCSKASPDERDRRGKALFIDARSFGHRISRTQIELSDDEIARTAGTYAAWRGQADAGDCDDVLGFCASAGRVWPMRHHARLMAPVEIRGLSKRFGGVLAVDDLSFDIEAGRVTGFLGPNGAGKSTTLRALLGLVRPTAGTATFGGRRYEELERPSTSVGAVLEDASFHPGRTGRNHLRVLAVTGQHPPERVEAVLDSVGLTAAADRHVKGYSMGMRQRLAIASALLGDPEVLILDEPTNGLDPPGIAWMRGMVRDQAALGRAVLVSSHLLAEVAQSVDDVVVIAQGRMRGHGTLEQVLGGDEKPSTEVRSQDDERLARALRAGGHAPLPLPGGGLLVPGAAPQDVGVIAHDSGVYLVKLGQQSRSLEQAFLALTGGAAA